MIVCHCANRSDRDIAAVAQQVGPDIDAVAEACGAGASCGTCRERLDQILASTTARVA